jgi:PAS domain S-box-containing protein
MALNGEDPAPPPRSRVETLLEGERAFALLVDAVQEYAIFLLDPQGTILTWNRGAQRIKGYAASEIIGQHFSVFYTAEERAEDLPAHVLEVARREGTCLSEGWRVRKDGTRFWADIVVTALRDPDGELYAYAKVTRDMSERRASEERERQLLAEREARSAAEEALRARERFLSIAAHELRTPVTTLRLSADLLLRRRAAARLDEQLLTTSIARIAKASGRLAELVDELLDVSKLTAPSFEPKRSEVDHGYLESGIVELYGGTHAARRLDFDAAPGLTIWADPGRVEQVVSNVIDNALKYSSEPSAITITVGPAEGGMLLTVHDEGIGIDSQALAAIHEPFTRGENAGTIEGLGLGLFISHGIVEAHGGWIRFESDGPGLGTTVRVWLPSGTEGERD